MEVWRVGRHPPPTKKKTPAQLLLHAMALAGTSQKERDFGACVFLLLFFVKSSVQPRVFFPFSIKRKTAACVLYTRRRVAASLPHTQNESKKGWA
jgi:hypothetical protein